ncbi:SMR family transporter [Arthrobacter sp. D1-17]
MAAPLSLNDPAFFIIVVAGYIASFAFLAGVLRAGLALGVAYGIWAALGVILTPAPGSPPPTLCTGSPPP